jgi:hypothetical protein
LRFGAVEDLKNGDDLGHGLHPTRRGQSRNPDLPIPSSGTPPLVVYFVVNKHGRAVREVSDGNAIIATGEKVE